MGDGGADSGQDGETRGNSLMEESYKIGLRKLCAAMILSAVYDLNLPDKLAEKAIEREAAIRWFADRDSSLFGYGFCLEWSGLHPNYVRLLVDGSIKDKDFIRKKLGGRTVRLGAKRPRLAEERNVVDW